MPLALAPFVRFHVSLGASIMLLTGTALYAAVTPVFAARGRLISKLIEGDPVAWSILGGVVALMVGWWGFKTYMGWQTESDE